MVASSQPHAMACGLQRQLHCAYTMNTKGAYKSSQVFFCSIARKPYVTFKACRNICRLHKCNINHFLIDSTAMDGLIPEPTFSECPISATFPEARALPMGCLSDETIRYWRTR